MLVLSRRLHERILFPDLNIRVQVVALKPGGVRLGIEAPAEVRVLREELCGPSAGPERPAARADARLAAAAEGLAALRRQLVGGQTRDALRTLAAVEAELKRLGATAPDAPKRRALLVEDNAQERELMARCLRSEGLDVDTAGDGGAALDYLHGRIRPDVVFLDMGMPRLDGPAAVRAIRRDPALAGLKIFAVSGHAPDEYGLPVGPAGVDRWFQKPVDPGDLLRGLRGELDGERARR